MKILIDTDVSDKLGITALELLFLHMLYHHLPNELSVDALMELGYVNSDGELTGEGREIVVPSVSDDMMWFVKTYDAYPHKVSTRVLKSKSIDSADGKHCLSKFKHYLKNNTVLGERMFKGLMIEKHLRKKGNSENFFQDIRTWFNQMTWDKYADLEVDSTIIEERVERI